MYSWWQVPYLQPSAKILCIRLSSDKSQIAHSQDRQPPFQLDINSTNHNCNLWVDFLTAANFCQLMWNIDIRNFYLKYNFSYDMWDFFNSVLFWSLHCYSDKKMITQRICSQSKKLVGWSSLVRSVNGNFPCYLSAQRTALWAKPQEQHRNSIWKNNWMKFSNATAEGSYPCLKNVIHMITFHC